MPSPFQNAARQLVADKTFEGAVEIVLGNLTRRILTATTPEDREMRFQEFDGLKRAWGLLNKEAAEATKQD